MISSSARSVSVSVRDEKSTRTAKSKSTTATTGTTTRPTLSHILASANVDDASSRRRPVDEGDRYNETNGHKLASFLQRFKFYFPARDQEVIEIPSSNEEDGASPTVVEPPSLEKAWHYFEHQCLPRRLAGVKDPGEGRKYMRAPPGDTTRPTKLYPVIDTPILDMSDFGIGVGMYFKTVRYFGVVTFLAGILSVPTLLYYQSPKYSPTMGDHMNSSIVDSLSAICTSTKFQPCPSCTSEDFNGLDGRLLSAAAEDGDMKFILVNNCELSDIFGTYALATMVFVIVSVYLFVYLQRRYRIKLDEGEQTTSDYSIQIRVSKTTTRFSHT